MTATTITRIARCAVQQRRGERRRMADGSARGGFLDGSCGVRPTLAVRPWWPLPACLLGCAAAESRRDDDPVGDAVPLVDLDPDPDRVRVILVAAPATVELLPGTTTAVWAYRDGADPDAVATVPGPQLRVPQGASVEIELRNALPSETTVHWHGVRVPADQDGTPSAQRAVAPGESFTYRFVAADAGTFWYHPHVEADVQIERGLYGALVVEADDGIEVDRERVLVLDDVKLDADGRLGDTDPLDLMLGRQGNVLLVDGRRRPSMAVRAGGRERWRLVNAANGRYFALRLDGATIWRVGSDGGLLAAPVAVDQLLVAPGERHDLVVAFGEPGSLALQTVHYDRGHDIPDPGPRTLADVEVVDGPDGEEDGPPSARWPTFTPLPVDDTTPRRTVVLSEDDADADDPRFFIDGAAFPAGEPVMVDQGALEVWTLRNDAEMDHPFHIHGLFFQVLDADGVPDPARGWKDTVNLPQRGEVSIAARFDNPGAWMMHCHILEHAERGMMAMLHVMAP